MKVFQLLCVFLLPPSITLARIYILELLELTKYPMQLQIWKAGYDQAIAELKRSNNANRWSGPGLVQRPG